MTDTNITVPVATPDEVAEMITTMPEDVARVFHGEDAPQGITFGGCVPQDDAPVVVDELPSKRGRKGFWPARLNVVQASSPGWVNATKTWETKHRQSVIQAIAVRDDAENFEVALRDGQVYVRYNDQSNVSIADTVLVEDD